MATRVASPIEKAFIGLTRFLFPRSIFLNSTGL
jgi:hypothetical protein